MHCLGAVRVLFGVTACLTFEAPCALLRGCQVLLGITACLTFEVPRALLRGCQGYECIRGYERLFSGRAALHIPARRNVNAQNRNFCLGDAKRMVLAEI